MSSFITDYVSLVDNDTSSAWNFVGYGMSGLRFLLCALHIFNSSAIRPSRNGTTTGIYSYCTLCDVESHRNGADD